MTPSLEFVRLRIGDTPEIAELVNRVWRAAYGPTGCPVFGADYLTWLYGGPDEGDTVLLGVRAAGRLVGFKAALSRPVAIGGRSIRAYQGTHLTVEPGLPLGQRLECLAWITHPSLLVPEPLMPEGPFDLAIVFYEEKKTIVQHTEQMLQKYGLVWSLVPVHQAILDPAGNRSAAARAADVVVRPGTEADLPVLASLWGRAAARASVALELGEAQLRHRLFSLPRSEVRVLEEAGEPTGFALYYLLELVKGGVASTVVAVEFLVFEGAPEAAAHLLEQAMQFARTQRARGVVMENAHGVPADARRGLGLVPSARRMRMALIHPGSLPVDRVDPGGLILLDVK